MMATADFCITGLALHGRHGALEAERSLGQHFLLDIDLTAEVGTALTSDKVEDTLHYGHVIKAASAAFGAQPYNLIETLAAAVADALLEQFPAIRRARITVHKPNAPVEAIIADLSATVERRR
jgi:dihydroneopterin aldolase